MASYSIIKPFKGQYVNAESARNYIDIDRFKGAYENITRQSDRYAATVAAVSRLTAYAGMQDYSVNGDSYDTHIDEYVETNFRPLITDARQQAEQILNAAVDAYNEKQERLNDDARRRDEEEWNRRNAMRV